jgi:CBS domain-containing protein
MRKGGYRHLVVLDQGDVIGIISLRDIVRAWQTITR